MDMNLVLSSNVEVEADDMPVMMMNDVDDDDNLSMIDFFDANDILRDSEIHNIRPAEYHQNLSETMTMPHPLPQEKQAERRTSIEFVWELWSNSSSADADAVDDDVMVMGVPSSCAHLAMAEDAAQHKMDVSNSSISSYLTASSSSSGSSFHHHGSEHSNSHSPPMNLVENKDMSSMHAFMNNSISDRVNNDGCSFNARHQWQQQKAAQYNDLLAKLAVSMKRSEQSRAEIMRHQKSSNQPTSTGGNENLGMGMCLTSTASSSGSATASSAFQRQSLKSSSTLSTSCAVPPSVTSFDNQLLQQSQQQQHQQRWQQQQISDGQAGFLSGSQSTLMIGLEQSRRQLATHVAQMRPHQTM